MKLFDYEKTTQTQAMVTIVCVGCGTTATIPTTRGRGIFAPLPLHWCFCGEIDGELARWCAQCQFEGRHRSRVSAAQPDARQVVKSVVVRGVTQ